MKTTEQQTHILAQKIIQLLIENELSISQQLKVIEDVKFRLNFCRSTGIELNQYKLEI